jgi:O-antigen/teichoic acid export membrane protein
VSNVATSPALARSPTRERRRTLDGAWLLSGATVGSGVLAYAYHVLAARSLGPEGYGLVAVLWAALFLGVVVLFRPLEQTASRAFAHRLARGEEVRTVLRAVTLIYLGLSVLVIVGGAATWNVLRDRLFLGDSLFVGALLVGTVAYGAAYVLRGVCGGSGWFRGYALLLVADGGVRLAVAAPLVFIASRDLAAAAAAAAAVGGLLLPLVVGRRLLADLLAKRPGSRFRSRTAVAFALPATVIAAADQVLVNGGPLLVMLGGGPEAGKAAGVVFAATMLIRVPVFVFQGLAASLLSNLTSLHAAAETALFRRAVLQASAGLVACTVMIVAGASALGPETMRLVYGPDYVVGRLELALLGVGVGCYMATAIFSQALLALDRGSVAAVGWVVSACTFLLVYAVLPGEPLMRVAVAFAVATVIAVILLVLPLSGRLGRALRRLAVR